MLFRGQDPRNIYLPILLTMGFSDCEINLYRLDRARIAHADDRVVPHESFQEAYRFFCVRFGHPG
jgi:hypothetical protein